MLILKGNAGKLTLENNFHDKTHQSEIVATDLPIFCICCYKS